VRTASLMRPGKQLTAEAEDLYFTWQRKFQGSCSCHISPPCGSCTHPGNPLCLEEDDDSWEDIPDDVAREASILWGSW
jgi:hypothetical protein